MWPHCGHLQLRKTILIVGFGWVLRHPISNCNSWNFISSFKIGVELQKLYEVKVMIPLFLFAFLSPFDCAKSLNLE